MKFRFKIYFTLIVFLFIFFTFSITAKAGKDDNVFGWWWSDGIGWISLNNCSSPTSCSGYDYGVNINENTNIVSGHAWSDNIGWITFNSSDWSDSKDVCPPGGCFSGGNVFGINGWARAINGKYVPHSSDGRDNRGGYDGWISLGGSKYDFDIDKTKDLASSMGISNKVINPIIGYGWGDQVIGWVQASSTKHSSYVMFDKACNPLTDPNCAKLDHNYFQIYINGNSTANIVGGDTVDIDWKAKQNFYPKSCTGSKGGSVSPYPDTNWVTTQSGYLFQQQSGNYKSIHVPPGGTTTFRLTCSDGKNSYYDEVDVTAKFTGGIAGGSCVNSTSSSTPDITWTTNDTSPDCTITAESFYSEFSDYTIPSSGSLSYSGSAPYKVNDTNYQYKDTFYKLNCKNGDSSYPATVGPITSFIKMCSSISDYVITSSDKSCNLVTEVPNSSPKVFKSSKTILSIMPNNFTADVDVSIDTSSGNPVGNFATNPSYGFKYSSSTYNDIEASLSLTSSELSQLINSKTFKGKIIQAIVLDFVGQSQNTQKHSKTIYYCVDIPQQCPNPNDPNDPKCNSCPDVNNPLCPCDPQTDPNQCRGKIKPKYVPF